MTPDQIKAIQDSFAKVVPISEQAAALFYGRLFEIAPAVKPLFRGDMKEQGRKLMATLAVVVNGLEQSRSGPAGRERACQAPRRLRRQGRRLHAGRRGIVVDAGTRPWRRIGRRISPPPGAPLTPCCPNS